MRRKWKIASIHLIVCSFLLVLVSSTGCTRASVMHATRVLPTFTSTPTPTPTSTSTPIPTPLSAPPPEFPPPFGVQVFEEVKDAAALRLAQEVGVCWLRMDVSWASIEPDQPSEGVHTYHWDGLDAAVASMVNAGFTPLLTIGRSPQWAVEDMPVDPKTGEHYNCGPIDPEDLDSWCAFIQALVERYDGDGIEDGPGVVNYWEIWNEPDGMGPEGAQYAGCWGGYSESDDDWDDDGVPDPQEYAEVLRMGYLAAKRADPDAQVCFGAIAYDRSWSVNWFNLDFAEEALSYLEGNYSSDPNYPFFDIMDFHFYINPALSSNWDPPTLVGKATGRSIPNAWYGVDYMEGRPSIKEILAKHGVDKPLICSEIGRDSDGPQRDVDPPETNEGQSRYVVRGFVRAMSLWPEVMRAVSWFTLTDPPKDRAWGLLETDSYRRKSSWYAYRMLTQELSGARYSGLLDAPGIEGHRFTMPNGSEKVVLWVPPKPASLNRRPPGDPTRWDFPVGAGEGLRVVRMYEDGPDEWRWEEVFIEDGGDGDLDGVANGQVRIVVDPNPQFVERTSMPAFTPTPTDTPTSTPTDTPTATPSSTLTVIPAPAVIPTSTPTSIPAATDTPTALPTPSPTSTPTPIPTVTSTPTLPATPTMTLTSTGLLEFLGMRRSGEISKVLSLHLVSEVSTPGSVTGTATSTAWIPAKPSPLLDRLVKDKPAIWGSKAFYILLGILYATLLSLFLKWAVNLKGRW